MSGIRVNEWLHNSGTGGIWQTSAGNVGIASSVPTAKLVVTGDANISGVTTAAAFIPSGGQLSHRNLIINGDMQVAQRATTSTTSASYTADRYRVEFVGHDEAMTHAQHTLTSSDTGPWAEGFRKSLHITNGNQTGGAGAGDYSRIEYRAEAQDMATSGWDYTSSSSYITLSYWVKSSVAQNFYNYIRTPDGTVQGYSWETGTLSANTWTKITKTIPGNSNITINDDTGIGLSFSFVLFFGTDFTDSGNTMNAWAAYSSGSRMPDNTSTWYTTNDSTYEITGVQLEVGSVATPFEHRSYADQLRRCQRYFQHHMSKENEGQTFATRFTTQAQGGITYYTALRSAPTATLKGVNIHVMSDGGNVDVTSMNMTIGGTNVTTQTSLVALITAGSLVQGDACLAHGNAGDSPMGIWLDSEL